MAFQPRTNFTVIGDSQDSQFSYPRLSDWNKLSDHQKFLVIVVLAVIVFVLAIVIGGFCCYNACCRRRQTRDHYTNHQNLATAEDDTDFIVRIRRPRQARRHYILSRHLHRHQNISEQIVEPQPVYVM